MVDAGLLPRLRLAVAGLEAKKAFQFTALDVAGRTSIADAFLICSVGSTRQAQAAADEVQRVLRDQGHRALSVEGYPPGSWILMDYGDFVLHIFLEETREYYSLERLWGDAPEITSLLAAAKP
jgi:ribosome-associated protein